MTLPERQSDAVTIVGFADTRRTVPQEDDREYWGLNALHRSPDVPEVPWTRWFEIHDIAATHQEGEDLDSHLKWLRGCGIPVYLRPQDMDLWGIPTAVPFPKALVEASFPPYFTNSISWMLALAILMEYKSIAVYGVDMAQDGLLNAEYSHQRPSCEFFLGVAAGRGIDVQLPDGSDLLKTSFQYGFEVGDGWTRKLLARRDEVATRKEALKQRAAQLQAELSQVSAGINQLDGALQDVEYWLRNWSPQPAAGG